MNAINPSYYVQSDGRQTIDHIEDLLGTEGTIFFCLGNAIKYLERAGRKKDNPSNQDIDKAKWYLNKAKSFSISCYYDMEIKQIERTYEKVVLQ